MAATEWYRHWFDSPFYHKLYFERDENEASGFILNLLTHLNPSPGSRMLDAACGLGRHSRLLADQGYEVTGIDLSMDSISQAKPFEGPNLHFAQHDLRLPAWIGYFDYAFNFFTSFGYFRTRREHDDAVRMLANSLRPGGTLLFDYLNVHYAEENLVHNETRSIGDTRYEIHRWMDENYFYKKITVSDPSLDVAQEFTEKVAKFSLGDFTDMLSFQGMQITEVFGDYSLAPYDVRKTPRMIMVGKKV